MTNKIIIIDDDPTGCQTVHGVSVITDWNKDLLHEALQEDIFFILSNSRSLSSEDARKTVKEIALSLKSVQGEKGFKIVSRSDSTLRGHFYEELNALMEVFGPFDGVVIAPFFAEGNRITKNDIHYIRQEDRLIPVSDTEFARDPVLGFTSSHLPDYIEEKSGGRWKKDECISVTIEDIRTKEFSAIAEKLTVAKNNTPIIINSEFESDLKVVVKEIKLAEQAGKRFLFRTGASFVKAYSGIPDKSLFMPEQPAKSCLIVAGSFVNLTTQQLTHLENHISVSKIEIDNKLVISRNKSYMSFLLQKIEDELSQNKKVLVCTERKYHGAGNNMTKVEFGKKLSAFICELVASITVQPDLIIAKGGITSHDVLKTGLGVEKATVIGQTLPGVPVLKLDNSGKFPGSLYVIFPGNVGGESALTEIIQKHFNISV